MRLLEHVGNEPIPARGQIRTWCILPIISTCFVGIAACFAKDFHFRTPDPVPTGGTNAMIACR
jgi:hypothetical protein